MLRRLFHASLLALLLAPALAAAAEVSATLDRNPVQLGETVTLNLRVSGDGGGTDAPDLRALTADFQILGTSRNSSLNIVNGKASSELIFGVALRPRHAGTLAIPALEVAGGRTAPLQLVVTPPDPAAAAASHQDVFMESQVEPAQGYVGQQLTYVLRLYYASRIGGDAPQAPQVDGTEISQLGKGLNYDTVRGGRNYHVLELRYALIPQRAGTLHLPAAQFQGEAADPRDPNSFFGATVPVSASAPAQTIEVKPAPADWGASAWLPARRLSLSLDGWPGAHDAPPRVGQPLNLTMNLQATGLSFEALPALSLPPLDGATVYPDKPVNGNRQDGEWITGRRQQAFAIVPERAGTLTIPATTLKWWNVLTGKAELAEIPAHTLTVLPASGAVAVPPAAATPASAPVGVAAPTVAAAAPPVPWRGLALGSLGLWLLSVLAWWWSHRRRAPRTPAAPTTANGSARSQRLAFLAAARGDDAAAQTHALLAWARAERPAIQHLGALAAALDDAAQRAAIEALQRHRYADGGAGGSGSELAVAFKHGFAWRAAVAGEDSALAPLYPFKLH